MHSWISRVAGAAVSLLIATSAWAGIPHGKLEFITPTATIGANDAIPIWVRFTLDVDSPAINFSSFPLTGFAAADLPTQGWRADLPGQVYEDFARIDSARFNAGMQCNLSFDCPGTGTNSYNFAFAFTGGGAPSLTYQDHLTLAPGQSYDYLFGTFTPKAGGAAPGTYSFSRAYLQLFFTGVNANGDTLFGTDLPAIAQTCGAGSALDCAFTRTVVAVPEPASYALMGLGLLVVGLKGRKRMVRSA